MQIAKIQSAQGSLHTALLALAVSALLAGCVTYSYPEPYELGTRNTDYVAAYADEYDVGYGHSFGLSTAYYPWWSMDYFYLGFNYGHPAFHWGYPGYYSPWVAYYRPWYYYSYPGFAYGWSSFGPYAGYGYGGYDSYWYHRYRSHAWRPPHHDLSGPYPGEHRPLPVGSHGGQLSGPGYRPGIEDAIHDRETMRRAQPGTPDRVVAPVRSTTVAPQRDDRGGMVVIGGGENKIRQSRPEPVRSTGGAFTLPSGSQRAPATDAPAVSVRPPMAMPRPEAPAARPEGRGMRGVERSSSDDGPAPFRGGHRPDRDDGGRQRDRR